METHEAPANEAEVCASEQIVTPSPGSPADRRGLLEKALSVVSEVRAGEGLGALLLTLNLFLLLGTYYVLKTVRETLILVDGGAEVKAYSSAAQAILLLVVVPAYGWIGTRINRNQLVRFTMIFFAANLFIFYLFARREVKIAIPYYIWVGIFNVFTISQLWAFASDLYDECQGKRLFPILGIGASLGAVAGAWAGGAMIKPLGINRMMLLSVAMLLVCAGLSRLSGYVIVKKTGDEDAKAMDKATLGAEGGFTLVMKDPYLRLIAILTVLLNVASLSGDFIMGKLVLNHANELYGAGKAASALKKQWVGGFFASYYYWTNLVGFLIQTFLVSRIFKLFGIRRALFFLPIISLATFASIAIYPFLAVARIFKIAENSVNYSLQNTVRHALLLPTSREAKYKAKAAIETFFVRFGDVLQAGVVFLGTQMAFSIRGFASISIFVTLAWIYVAVLIFRRHKVLAPIHH